ncbi:MAG TPA: hypothetical protein VH475_03385 [Tepidisphaeraceae bacterium]|jgi:hypothetical protein
MNLKRTKAWILSAAIAGGIASFAPMSVNSALAAQKDREEWVKYEDLPRDVKRSIDQERGRYDVKRIDHVWRDGREFYRATLDTKGGTDTTVRVDPNGRVLSIQDTGDDRGVSRDLRSGDETQVKYSSLPARVKDALDRERGNRDIKSIYQVNRGGEVFYRALVDERNGDREIRVNESGKILSAEDVREARTASGVRRGSADYDLSDYRRGDRVDFDRLPGEVKTALGREAGSDRVQDVTRYERNGRSVYRAEVGNRDTARTIVVDEGGRVLSGDRGDAADTTNRRSVNFRDLPGEVKSGIGSKVNDVDRVTEYTRGGRTYYQAEGKNGDHVTVDDRGRVVRD